MTQINDSGEGAAPRDGHVARWGSWFRRATVVTALLALGGVMFAPQATHSSGARALARGMSPRDVAALTPPDGTTWIVGTLTDQAAHGQDNVNVEAWPDDPTATAPAASALTYGGPNYKAIAAHGFFRLEVPSGLPYKIVFSAVNGKEDGDPFRKQRYGQGRPIVVRTPSRATAGRVRDLGTIQLVRQGKVVSKTKAAVRPAKVKVGQVGKMTVTVTSKYVSNVTGRVSVKVGGHKIKGKLKASAHGKVTMKLPKFHKAGKQKIVARFLGTNTVHSSVAKPVKVTVVKK